MKQLTLFILTLLAFSACYEPENNELDRLLIKEGRHRSTPYSLTWNDDSLLVYAWHGDESQAYNLGNVNQCDWNKLTGWSFHPFGNHENAVMVGWRYDLSGYRYFAPYYHENGNTWWASASCTSFASSYAVDRSLPVLRVDEFSDVVETHYILRREERYTAIAIINKTTGRQIFWERYWDSEIGNVREIYPWFGGDESAPHDIYFHRRLLDRQ